MPNVILEPIADNAARQNYQATIESTVALSVIQTHVSLSVIEKLTISGNGEEVCVWGVRSTHKKAWERTREGDVILFSRQNRLYSEATVITKTNCPGLARQLWGLSNGFRDTWHLMYFISSPIKRDIPYETFNELVGSADNFTPLGFTVLKSWKSEMYLSYVHEFADKALEESWPLDTVTEPKLTHYDEYTREDVHDIFSPGTPFHAGAGTWGLQGIVPVSSGSTKDFVFFVTFGQKQSGHVFDEMITGDGILTCGYHN
jgi:hypothetical protein